MKDIKSPVFTKSRMERGVLGRGHRGRGKGKGGETAMKNNYIYIHAVDIYKI